MLEFREYEDNDYANVVKLIKDSFDIDVSNIDSDPNVYRLVGVLDNEVVSYLDITYCLDVIRNYKYSYINYVCVSPNARGNGIGYKMMEEAISICKNNGCSKIKLTSNPKRCQAREMYKKCGFEIKDTDVFEKVI